jgi:hypothetical protein
MTSKVTNKISKRQALLLLLIQGEKEISHGNGFSLDSVLKEADLIVSEAAKRKEARPR